MDSDFHKQLPGAGESATIQSTAPSSTIRDYVAPVAGLLPKCDWLVIRWVLAIKNLPRSSKINVLPAPLVGLKSGTAGQTALFAARSNGLHGEKYLEGVVLISLFLEIERPFFQRVNVAHHQDRDETKHAPENDSALFDCVPVNHRPRIHEYDFEVEQDEEHRD